jgi:hypothetical protein
MVLHGCGLVGAPWPYLLARSDSLATTWLWAHGGSLALPPYYGGLSCRHMALGPWWLHLPIGVGSHAAMWLGAFGGFLAPSPC